MRRAEFNPAVRRAEITRPRGAHGNQPAVRRAGFDPALRRGARVALLAVALIAPGAAAQWTAGPSAAGGPGSDATVRNDGGEEVRIWVDVDRNLRASFQLSSGLASLDPAGCPTFQIDDKPPEDLSREAHECAVDGPRAELVLARARDGEVVSPTLLSLMNGSNLTVRYRLAHAGYGASRFSLRGSKQALTAALGDGLTVVGD